MENGYRAEDEMEGLQTKKLQCIFLISVACFSHLLPFLHQDLVFSSHFCTFPEMKELFANGFHLVVALVR